MSQETKIRVRLGDLASRVARPSRCVRVSNCYLWLSFTWLSTRSSSKSKEIINFPSHPQPLFFICLSRLPVSLIKLCWKTVGCHVCLKNSSSFCTWPLGALFRSLLNRTGTDSVLQNGRNFVLPFLILGRFYITGFRPGTWSGEYLNKIICGPLRLGKKQSEADR